MTTEPESHEGQRSVVSETRVSAGNGEPAPAESALAPSAATVPVVPNPTILPAPAAPSLGQSKDILILLYGIRDRGSWTQVVKKELERPNLEVIPIPYGYFDVLRFLLPVFFRARVVRYVERNLRNVIANHYLKHPTADISILAHSFGCYVAATMLSRDPFLKLKRLVFCGSVVNYAFPSDILLRQVDQFINDCGTKDIWPVLAARVTWGYGDTGVFGFGLTANDRFHNCNHSGFFRESFIKKYWESLFHDGSVVSGDPPAELRWYQRILFVLPLKWIIFALLLWLLWMIWPRIHVGFTNLGVDVSNPISLRREYSFPTVAVTPYYANKPGLGLVPPNSKGLPEDDLVQAMFVWKKWTKEAAKAPVGDMTKALITVWSDEAFAENYFTFGASVKTKDNWRIVEGCAFLTVDRDIAGKYRPVYRQLDLDVPVSGSALEYPKLEIPAADHGEKLFMILRVESTDGATIPQNVKDFNISVDRR